MNPPPRRSVGLFASIRHLLETGLAMVQNRVELLAVELQEEKCRFIGLLLLAGTGFVLVAIALPTLTFAAVLAFDEQNRPRVALILGILYLAGAAVIFLRLHHRLQNGPKPFSETRAQLNKDRECLTKENSSNSPNESGS